MTEESKENPPPGGYGNDERDDTDRQRAEEAPVSRLEMETWEREGRVEMEKLERHVANEFKEVRYQFEVIAGRFEDMSAVVARLEEMSGKVEEISGQMDQLQRMIQQVANNSSSNSAAVADGSGRGARERQMQKLELGNDVAMWRRPGPRRHWFVRGRAPQSTGESVDDLQALLGDMLEVTAEVAQQLRALGGFDVLQFRPRMEAGSSDRDVPVADRFDLLRQALGSVLRLGFKDTVARDALCLARTHKIDACFVDASMSLRAHVLKHYSFLSGAETTKILGNMINEDLRLWVGDLTRTVQAEYSATVPPEADAMFVPPPLPGFPALREFVRGGGTMYKLLRADSGGGASAASGTGKRTKGASVVSKFNKRSKSNACFQFSQTRTCSFGDGCKFAHDKPAVTEARVPAGGGARGRGGDGAASARSQGGDGVSNALVVRATGGGGRGVQGGGSGRGAPGSG